MQRPTILILLASTLLLGTAVPAAYGQETLPSGGTLAAGSATISTSADGSGLTVDQSSPTAILNWQGFSIGTGNSARFNNGAGATLNRVTGNVPSVIDGSLSATGSVYLVNPSGVVVGNDGRVATGGAFVASTLDVSNGDFLDGGNLTFSGGSVAPVVNMGTINSAQGNVALIGRIVENDGTLGAPNGTAGLAAGRQVLMRDAAGTDGLLSVEVGGPDTSAVNKGAIRAAAAEMRANGGNVYALAGNTKSVVEATGVAKSRGRIFLTAGDGGAVKVTQKLVARRQAVAENTAPVPMSPIDRGGDITISGGDITLAGTIEASGTNGGAGGTVSAIAEGAITVTGSIDASGAPGGSIETSGHTLDIGAATIDSGPGGQWLLDPYDLTVDDSAAATISGSLNGGTSVTLQTTASGTSGPGNADASGSGDITIASALIWGSTATLTLDAYHSIHIDAPVTVSGGGGMVLTTNDNTDGITDGDYDFGLTATGFRGRLDYGSIDNGGTLTINGAAYTLLYSMADLQAINTNSTTLTGNYALATVLDGSTTTGWVPIGTDGAGGLENSNHGFQGAFTGLGHTVSDLTVDTGTTDYAGLFGYSEGVIRDIGLGGGAVSGLKDVGALVGKMLKGNVSNVFATSTVSGGTEVGGLVGNNYNGAIGNAYATGTVTGSSDYIGGLLGYSDGKGAISNSYATGAVSGNSGVGGLVGVISNGTYTFTISDSYATGAVSGSGLVGGLLGNGQNFTIDNAFATGAVSGGSYLGGLAGNAVLATITNSYWDSETTGQSSSAGSPNSDGMATADLQGALPSGFDSSVWGTGAGIYPYLQSVFPNGVQAISGTAYESGGVVPLASGSTAYTITALADGSTLGTATTGANGYYYIAVPSGTVTGGTALLAYSDGGGAGARLDTGASALDANGNAGSLDIWGGALIAPTAETTYSAASATDLQTQDAALISTAVGRNTDPTTGLTQYGYIASGDFTVDQALTLTNGLYVKAAGDIAVSGVLALPGAQGLDLDTAGALSIGAPIDASNGAHVTLGYDDSDPANLSFGLTGAGFAGKIDYGPTDKGGTLAMDGAAYTLIYSMSQLDALDGFDAIDRTGSATAVSGKYALATSLDASSEGTYATFLLYKFKGKFEGSGNVISNLDIANSNDGGWVGLMRNFYSGTVRDLGLADATISGGVGAEVGVLAGRAKGSIYNVFTSGQVSGGNASSHGSVDAGGVVGRQAGGTVSNVFSTADVMVGDGGDSTGAFAGGLFGTAQNVSISNAYATGAITGGDISVYEAQIGGLVGDALSGTTISNAYATGTVTGGLGATAGGLVGTNHATITQSYATGAVTTGDNSSAGGLIGYNHNDATATLTEVYATGALNGGAGALVGGIVGDNENTASDTVETGYFDTDTTGVSAGIGGGSGELTGGIGLTTTQWLTDGPIATATFDSTAWVAGYPYPVLKALPHIIVTGSGSHTYGDTAPAAIITSIEDQAGTDATARVDTSGLTWLDALSATDNAGAASVLGGSGATASAGYQLTYMGASSVTKRPITITADILSRTYGDANPTFTYTVGGDGLVNGDRLSGALATWATVTSNVGDYGITRGTLAASANYDITSYTGGTLTVNARPITITADATSKTYGDGAPSYSYTVTGDGLANSDALSSVSLASAGDAATAGVGSYDITSSNAVFGVGSASNYAITYATLTNGLTVTPGPLTPESFSRIEQHPAGSGLPQWLIDLFEAESGLTPDRILTLMAENGLDPALVGCLSGVNGPACSTLAFPDNWSFGPWLRFAPN